MRLPDRLTQWLLQRAYASKLNRWRLRQECEAVSSREDLHKYVASHVGRDNCIHYLEFGVYKGATIKLWCRENEHPRSRFVGFDSFEGLPEHWNRRYSEGHFSTGGAIPSIDDPRVQFCKGWFSNTLPDYMNDEKFDRPVIVHLDADLYSSTLYVFSRLAPVLTAGTIIILDDFLYALDVFRAFTDFQQVYPVQLTPLVSAPSARGTPFAQLALTISSLDKC